MVRNGPFRPSRFSGPRLPAVAASFGVLGGAALPYVSILGRSKSAFSLARSAQRLDVFSSPVQRIAVLAVLMVPLLVGLLVGSACFRSPNVRKFGALVSLVVGLVGVGSGVSGYYISVAPYASHAILSSCGAIAVFCSMWLFLGREQVALARWVNIFGVLCAAVLTVAGALFAYDSIHTRNPRTPTEAARLMYSGLEDQDPFQMLGALPPAERNLLADSGLDLMRQLRRLELVGQNNDENKRRSTSQATKRTYRETVIAGKIVNVQVMTGNIYSPYSAGEVALHPRIARVVEGTGLVHPEASSASIRPATIRPTLTTIEVGGAWYVSLGHSYVDGARRQSGSGFPRVLTSTTNVGASNPESAVRAFLGAAADFDVVKVLDASDPSEAAVGYSYVNLVLPELSQRAKSARAQVGLTFPELSLVTARDGNVATVRVKRWSALAVLYADDVSDSIVRLDRDCVSVTVASAETIKCGRQVPLVLSELYGVSAREWTPEQARWLSEPQRLPGIVTVRRNGKWFVSPTRTAVEMLVYWLKGLEPTDLIGKGNSLAERFAVLASAVSVVAGS